MGIFIWIIRSTIVIHCIADAGCVQSSMAHFDYLVAGGSIELIFELAGIVKIFMKKSDKPRDIMSLYK